MGANGLYWSPNFYLFFLPFVDCTMLELVFLFCGTPEICDCMLAACYSLVLDQMLVEIMGIFYLFYVVNYCNVVNFNFLRNKQ